MSKIHKRVDDKQIMCDMEKKALIIAPLTKDEKEQLKGGFTSVSRTDESTAISNGNCSSSDGWFNDNCGCSNCTSQETRPTEEIKKP